MKLEKDEYLKSLYEDRIESINESRMLIEKNLGNTPGIYEGMKFARNVLGILEYLLNNNVVESKKNFYRSTLVSEWIYNEYDKGKYKIRSGLVTTYGFESLFYAVLSGNKERAIHMANLFGGRPEEEKDDFFSNILLGYGFKYVILDDKENAYDYINKLEESKDKRGMKQYNNGYKRVYKGIIDRDEKELNEGLLFMLKNHKARMKRNGNTLEQYFAYDSLALAMIAKDRGINIEINHELLPLEFLEPVDIDYSKLGIFD
ncbi:MAG: Imm49 family immunity protein [Clostridiaceae bacterium]